MNSGSEIKSAHETFPRGRRCRTFFCRVKKKKTGGRKSRTRRVHDNGDRGWRRNTIVGRELLPRVRAFDGCYFVNLDKTKRMSKKRAVFRVFVFYFARVNWRTRATRRKSNAGICRFENNDGEYIVLSLSSIQFSRPSVRSRKKFFTETVRVIEFDGPQKCVLVRDKKKKPQRNRCQKKKKRRFNDYKINKHLERRKHEQTRL